MTKTQVKLSSYETKGGETAYKVIDKQTGLHIKTTNSAFIRDFVEDKGFIWLEDNKRGFSKKEKTEIRLEYVKGEISKLYVNYPEISESVKTAKVESRNVYNKTEDDAEQKYGVSFDNKTSLYITERLFNDLYEYPIKHLNR